MRTCFINSSRSSSISNKHHKPSRSSGRNRSHSSSISNKQHKPSGSSGSNRSHSSSISSKLQQSRTAALTTSSKPAKE